MRLTRQQKYPETSTFHYFNANPHHRITGDCVYRAIAEATHIPWEQVVMDMAEIASKTGYDPTSTQVTDKYLAKLGWVKMKQPRKADNTKYTGSEFCRKLTERPQALTGSPMDGDTIVAHIGGHHQVCIEYHSDRMTGDGFKVWDIWNSTDGCIGNWWYKPYKK